MILLQLFADHLLPLFLMAGAGYALAAALKLDGRGFAAVAFNLFAPCLVFRLLIESRVPPAGVLLMAGFTAASLALPATAMFLLARWRGWSRTMTSAAVLCVLLPNSGNLGMSASLLAFGPVGLEQASLYFLGSSIVSSTVGILVASLGRVSPTAALRGLLRVPILWALALACGLRFANLRPPAPVERAVWMVADACIPSLLVILGIQLRNTSARRPSAAVLTPTLLRLAGGMAAGIALAQVFALEGAARQAAVFQSSMPTAVITSIIASEYDVEPRFVSSVVLLTTLLCPLSLTLLLAWLT